MLADGDGRIVYANRAAQVIFDATPEELAQSSETCVDAQRLAAYARVEGLESGHGGPTVRVLTRHGTPVFLDVALTFLSARGSQARTLITFRDITAEVRLVRQVEAHDAVAKALLRREELVDVLRIVAEQACTIFDASFASITMPYPSGAGLTLAVSHTAQEDEPSDAEEWPPHSVLRDVLCSSRPRLMEGSAFPRPEHPGSDPRIGCGFVLPIVSAEMAVGVLSVAVPKGHPAHRLRDFAAASDYAAKLGETLGLALAARQRDHLSQNAMDQLKAALENRIVIEQAKGMLAERREVSPDEAFKIMQVYASRQRVGVGTVAERIVSRALMP